LSRSLLAPEIPGLTYVSKLGSGGYADVYLYEQQMPSRRVAVKVLRETGLSASAVNRFTAEANAMAQLEHPHIVPVYAAGLTMEGRPYLVMMYYPKASLAERVRTERLSVAEVLRIGIQIGSAVETAHRAGLLHRDIKPANVLTNQYGTPGLTDFGIAAQIADVDDEDTGVSVPWSPPEVLYATAPASARSDVYSLASTLWHLLVGRSAFEVPGGDNSSFALMKRIRDTPPPPTGRPDVPASLERLLRSAMAREVTARPATALDLVRSLQAIEQELRYQRTPIVVADDRESGRSSVDATPPADATRVKGAQVVSAQPIVRQDYPPTSASSDRTVVRGGTPQASDEFSPTREMAGRREPEPTEQAERRVSVPVMLVSVLAVVAIVVGAVYLSTSRPKAPAAAGDSVSIQPPQFGEEVLRPGSLRFTHESKDGSVTFSWDYDHALASDSYSWRRAGKTSVSTITQRSLTLPLDGKRVCIEVRVVRADHSYADQAYEGDCSS